MKTLILLLSMITALSCNAQSVNTNAVSKAERALNRQTRIDKRQDNLDRRIDQGVAKGKLTTNQAAGLEAKLDQLKQDEAKALQNDGKISHKEFRVLRFSANELSKDIRTEKRSNKSKQ